MALYLNTNINSLVAQGSLTATGSRMTTAIQRLSTGLRINSAKDDAAGLAISDLLTAQVQGLNQALRNANDGISLSQTAEGALQETSNNVLRIRELSVQALNGTNSPDNLKAIQAEITLRLAEIDRISAQSDFNGIYLLNGSVSSVSFQVGARDLQTIAVMLQKMDSSAMGINTISVTGGTISNSILATLDSAVTIVDKLRGDLGAAQNRFGSVVASLTTSVNNLSESLSRIKDADYASETGNYSKARVQVQAGVATLAQANAQPYDLLKLLPQ